MHQLHQTLPTLAAIEKRFAGEAVAVVGVHSPKFDAETERERLRAAIQQYEIHHPVAIDGSMNVWNAWGVRGWPTLFVLDAHGRAVWSGSGEPDANQLASIEQGALDEGMWEGSLNPHGLRMAARGHHSPAAGLSGQGRRSRVR